MRSLRLSRDADQNIPLIEERFNRIFGPNALVLRALQSRDGGRPPENLDLLDSCLRHIAALESQKASLLRFSTMAGASPVGIFSTNPDGTQRYGNETYSKYFGPISNRAIEIAWAKGNISSNIAEILDQYRFAVAQRAPFVLELEQLRGEIRQWISIVARPVESEGVFFGYVGFAFDVSERREIANALQRSERMVRDVAEASLDAFFVLEPIREENVVTDFRFIYVSQKAVLLTHKRVEDLLGSLLSSTLPPDRRDAYLCRYRDVLVTGITLDEEVPGGAENSGRTYLLRASRVADGVGVTVRDITEFRRLQSEAELRAERLHKLNRDLRSSAQLLAKEHAFLNAVLSTAACLVCVTDNNGVIIRFNTECERLTGLPEEEVSGMNIYSLLLPEETRRRWQYSESVADNQEPVESTWTKPDGSVRTLEWRGTPIVSDDGDVEFLVLTGVDVTEKKRRLDSMAAANKDFELAQRIAGIGSWELNLGTGRGTWSPSVFDIHGLPPTEQPPEIEELLERVHRDDADLVRRALNRAATEWVDQDFTYRLPLANGGERYVRVICKADRARNRLYGTVMDVSDRVLWEQQLEDVMTQTVEESIQLELQARELALLNAKLGQLATTDALTGVPNRRAFDEQLDAAIRSARSSGIALSLVLADVDHFKRFNDEFGHRIGDLVLKQVAHSLSTAARTSDFVARYGGEEFAIILPGADLLAATYIAERMRAQVSLIDWESRPITASFGVAELAPHHSDAATLITEADAALYRAKASGRNIVRDQAA